MKIMGMIRRFAKLKYLLHGTVIFCAACLMATVISAALYVRSFAAAPPEIYASAANEIKVKVIYLENDLFGSGERPAGLSGLMSFTDRIEIVNSYNIELDGDAEVLYRYSAVAALSVKYQKGSDNNTNPVVYRKTVPLDELNGSAAGSRLSFDGGGLPGGAYTVDPEEYIEYYKYFVTGQHAQMRRKEMVTERALNFSADLSVDFSCDIRVPEYGINHTLKRSAVIPLTNEVFDISFSGNPFTDLSVPAEAKELGKQSLFVVILLVLWFTANVFGAAYCSRRIILNKITNLKLHDAERIVKKYSDEIVISKNPIDLSDYKIIEIEKFKELLNLAVSLSKHILCFRDDKGASFYVVADNFAYSYIINFE